MTDYQLRWLYFAARDDDGRPLPRPKPGEKGSFRPASYKELFYHCWVNIRGMTREEVDNLWRDYVADCEARGQPVDPDTGRPLRRYQEFDPLPVDESVIQAREAEYAARAKAAASQRVWRW